MAAVISRNDPAFDEALLDRASVAFGVFDGVHEGHRFIIGEAVNTAREEGRASAVITFDIDPDEVFAADRLKKLMTNEARIAKLAELDVDAVVVLPFSREFAAQSPEDFLNACFGGEPHPHRQRLPFRSQGRGQCGELARVGRRARHGGART